MTDQTKRANPFEGWTTIQDAARITGRDRITIMNWARQGHIACYQIGPRIEVVNLKELRAFSKTRPTYNRKRPLDNNQDKG